MGFEPTTPSLSEKCANQIVPRDNMRRVWDLNPREFPNGFADRPFQPLRQPFKIPACQRTTYRINNLQRLFMMIITCKSYIFEPGIRIELMSPEYHTEILPLNYPDLFERTTKNPMFLRHRVLFNSTISLFKMKTITQYQYYFCRL